MYIRELYSSLNVLYLKLYQYEKYLDEKYTDSVFEDVNLDLELLRDKYTEEFDLLDMQVNDFFELSKITPKFSENKNKSIVHMQLIRDCKILENLKVSIYKN